MVVRLLLFYCFYLNTHFLFIWTESVHARVVMRAYKLYIIYGDPRYVSSSLLARLLSLSNPDFTSLLQRAPLTRRYTRAHSHTSSHAHTYHISHILIDKHFAISGNSSQPHPSVGQIVHIRFMHMTLKFYNVCVCVVLVRA